MACQDRRQGRIKYAGRPAPYRARAFFVAYANDAGNFGNQMDAARRFHGLDFRWQAAPLAPPQCHGWTTSRQLCLRGARMRVRAVPKSGTRPTVVASIACRSRRYGPRRPIGRRTLIHTTGKAQAHIKFGAAYFMPMCLSLRVGRCRGWGLRVPLAGAGADCPLCIKSLSAARNYWKSGIFGDDRVATACCDALGIVTGA